MIYFKFQAFYQFYFLRTSFFGPVHRTERRNKRAIWYSRRQNVLMKILRLVQGLNPGCSAQHRPESDVLIDLALSSLIQAFTTESCHVGEPLHKSWRCRWWQTCQLPAVSDWNIWFSKVLGNSYGLLFKMDMIISAVLDMMKCVVPINEFHFISDCWW